MFSILLEPDELALIEVILKDRIDEFSSLGDDHLVLKLSRLLQKLKDESKAVFVESRGPNA